jgi:hypothetical protein
MRIQNKGESGFQIRNRQKVLEPGIEMAAIR